MKLINLKEECEEFEVFVSMVIGRICLIVAFLNVVGLMLTGMVPSIALLLTIASLYGFEIVVSFKNFNFEKCSILSYFTMAI